MQSQFNFGEITAKAADYLEKEFDYTPETLRRFRFKWFNIRDYMESQNRDFISPAICQDYLGGLFNGRSLKELSRGER